MKEIPLTRGLVALVDDEDHEELMKHKWSALKCPHSFYAVRNVYAGGRWVACLLMHRVLLNAPDEIEVDHVNRNGLDNQRSNIRLATTSQNQANSGLDRRNTSGFKGVSWDSHRQRWLAGIEVRGQSRNLGRFRAKEGAARAYDQAALEAFGHFAYLNFPHSPNLSGT